MSYFGLSCRIMLAMEFKLSRLSGPFGCYTGDHVLQSPTGGGMSSLRDNDADSSVVAAFQGKSSTKMAQKELNVEDDGMPERQLETRATPSMSHVAQREGVNMWFVVRLNATL